MKQSECKTQKEYDELFYKNTIAIIQKLVDFVNNNKKASYDKCIEFIEEKNTFNKEYYSKNEWQFDFHTDYFTQTLSKEKGRIRLCEVFEVWDDDYVAGSGKFSVSENVINDLDSFVKKTLGKEHVVWLV